MKRLIYVLVLLIGVALLIYINIPQETNTTDYCKIELRNHADELHQEIDNAKTAFKEGNFDSGMYILENVPKMKDLLECDY